MKLHIESRKHVSYVELERDGKNSIGISVKEGTKYGLRPVIKSIKGQSLSHRSHCVAEGDVILSICGQDSRGMTKKDVRRILKEAYPHIALKLEYEIHEASFNSFGVYHYRRLSLTVRKESGSFGFILRKNDAADSAATEYPIISNVRPGGPADREISLKDGDRLLQIDDQSLSWLSLREISNILKEKEEATFTVEYNVRIIDSCLVSRQSVEVEIDCPDMDLGMVLDSSTQGLSNIFIKEIRAGSLAQRCGAFNAGDVISTINDIDATLLTASKANSLLQHFRKEPGKLTFIPSMGTEQLQGKIYTKAEKNEEEKKDACSRNAYKKFSLLKGSTEYHTLLNTQSTAVPEKCTVSSMITSQGSSGTRNYFETSSDFPRFNNPDNTDKSSVNAVNHSPNYESIHNLYNFQTKTISMFRDIVQSISHLQHFMSYFHKEAANCMTRIELEREFDVPKEQSTNISSGVLSQLDAVYLKTKDLVCKFTMHLVKNTKNVSMVKNARNSFPNTSEVPNAHSGNEDMTMCNLIHQLVEDLSEIHHKKFISKRTVDKITASLSKIESDCSECHKLCLSVALLTQKVLLLLSLNDIYPNIQLVISEVTEDLIQLHIPCENCERRCSVSQIEVPPPVTENFYFSPKNLLNTKHENVKNSLNINSDSAAISKQSLINAREPMVALNISEENAYIELSQPQVCFSKDKLGEGYVQIQSKNTSGQNTASKDFVKVSGVPAMAKQRFFSRLNRDSEIHSKTLRNKVYKDKDLIRIPKQAWKSVDAISENKEEFYIPTATRPKSVILKNIRKPSDFVRMKQSLSDVNMYGKYTKHSSAPSDPIYARCGAEDSSSSDAISQAGTKIQVTDDNLKIEVDTTEVKLLKEGKDFGLNFEFIGHSDEPPSAPVITVIQPESAAQKCGILLKGDRILSINGHNLMGLNPKELERVKKKVFFADEIQMLVEFDVAFPEIKFGIFDVHIDKTIKPGLEFKEFRKSSPLVVKGVVKGSAAHRSGLLFPGDEILFTNCIRQESYDSYSCSYKRVETVILTVRREADKETSGKELEPDIEVDSINRDFRQHSSHSFTVYRTLVRVLSGTKTKVLDHEVSLFRDPVQKDFGFLVGQNPSSGRIYVTGIRPGGPADRSKVIKKNDRILEVNGNIIGKHNKSTILSLFLQESERIDLIIRRILCEQK